MRNAETMPIPPEEQLAKLFHETYERLAPHFGYQTRKETALAWEAIPETSPNKRLMIAVCKEILGSAVFQTTDNGMTDTRPDRECGDTHACIV